MEKIWIVIYYWVFACFWLSCCCNETLDVYISDSLGHDHENCSSIQNPCKSINYGYQKVMQNETITRLNLKFIGNCKLNESLIVNISHSNLKLLQITSQGQRSTIFGGVKKLISFGCKNRNKTKCIEYNVTVENLAFTNFHQQSVISIFRCPPVKIINCHFIDNNSSAIKGVDTDVLIDNCTFEGSHCNLFRNARGPWTIGGSVGFLFFNCVNRTVEIKNSHFKNNSADLNSENYKKNFYDPEKDFRYLGGGASAVFCEESSSNTFKIEGCIFEKNRALFGGGLSLNAVKKATGNTLIVKNTIFLENHAKLSGGGFSLKTLDNASSNAVTFSNVTFVRNNAENSGGAGKLLFQNEDSHPTQPLFLDTTFIENRARIDAALGIGNTLRSIHVIRRHTIAFQNTRFVRNTLHALHDGSGFIHTGVVMAFNVDLHFQGTNIFEENSLNSPLYVCASNVNVAGNLTFSKNRAYYCGGGMSLMDESTLLLMPGANLLFYKNYANVRGGAMFYDSNMIENEVYSYNPICFLQYKDRYVAASKWDINMTFIGNGAGFNGAAIYAATISQCKWHDVYPFISTKKVFKWSDRFSYSGNFVGSRTVENWRKYEHVDVATDGNRYSYKGSHEIAVQPGQEITLNISAIDEYNQTIASLATISNEDFWENGTQANRSDIVIKNNVVVSTTGSSYRNPSFAYTLAKYSNYDSVVKGANDKIHTVDVIDYSSIYGARMRLRINPVPCAPGYKFNETLRKCICDKTITGVTRCSDDIIYIKDGYWANVSSSNRNKLITFECPRTYCDCHSDPQQTDCMYEVFEPNNQCVAGRMGMLCGTCKPGNSITLPSYTCKVCDNEASSLAIFIIVIIVTACLCVAVIFTNPGLSDYLVGIFFYTQILPYVFTFQSTSARMAQIFSTVVNSVAVGSMPVEMCLFNGLDLIDAIGLSYTLPSICALVLAAFFLLSKFRLLTFRRDSPFSAFWILITVAYKLLVETSLLSLACFRVDDELVFFYDASVKCFSKEHLALFIPSTIIFAFLVIPMPFVIVLISHGFIRVSPHVSDVITKGYRKEYRWWCAVDFLRRILFSAIYIFCPDWALKQALFVVASVSICMLYSIVNPYTNKFANYAESFLLGFLTLIASFQAMSDASIRETGSIIAISLTMVYTAIIIAYLLVMVARRKYRKWRNKDDTRKTSRAQSPRDIHGRPYNIPKRLVFDRQKPKPRGNINVSEEDKPLVQPLIQVDPPEEL